MSVVILSGKLNSKDIQKARKDYKFYIKITADIKTKTIAIGGEYHADAEKILIEKYSCKSKDIWGGGYNFQTKNFETNAVINLRPPLNNSMEIVDPDIRKKYIELVREKLKCINQVI